MYTCIKLSHLFCTIYSISKVWYCLIFFGHFEPILGQFVLFFGVGVGSRIDFWSYLFIHITSVNPQEPFCGYCYIFRMNNTVDFKKCDGPSEWVSEWVSEKVTTREAIASKNTHLPYQKCTFAISKKVKRSLLPYQKVYICLRKKAKIFNIYLIFY